MKANIFKRTIKGIERPQLQQVWLEGGHACWTDGHRAQIVDLGAPETGSIALADLPARMSGEITLLPSGLIAGGRLIPWGEDTGEHPHMGHVVPTHLGPAVNIDGALLGAILKVLSKQEEHVDLMIDAETLAIEWEGGRVVLSGSPAGPIEILGHTLSTRTDAERVRVNTRYLLDAVELAGGSPVTIALSGELSPVLVVGAVSSLVMPMRRD